MEGVSFSGILVVAPVAFAALLLLGVDGVGLESGAPWAARGRPQSAE